MSLTSARVTRHIAENLNQKMLFLLCFMVQGELAVTGIERRQITAHLHCKYHGIPNSSGKISVSAPFLRLLQEIKEDNISYFQVHHFQYF